ALGQGRLDRRHRGQRARVPQRPEPNRALVVPANEGSRPLGGQVMATYRIAVLPGDGIGQEVTPEAVRVLEAVGKGTGTGFEFERGLVGGAAIDATGKPLAAGTLVLGREAHAILFGAVGGPKADDVPHAPRPARGLLTIRKELDLYANLRPAKCFPMLVDASPPKPQVVLGPDP